MAKQKPDAPAPMPYGERRELAGRCHELAMELWLTHRGLAELMNTCRDILKRP